MTEQGTRSSHDASRTAHRQAVSYIDASRVFYAAHGYEMPYQWATHDDAPFHPLEIDLGEATIGVVTTAFPHGQTSPKRAMAVAGRPIPTSLFTADLSWHKEATHTDDVGTFLPLAAIDRASDRIGGISRRFYCAPPEYSQRKTREDAARIARWCDEDGVDVAILVPI